MASRIFWCTICVMLSGVAHSLAAAPEATSFKPVGGQRGTTVEVTVSGKFANWPVQAWVDRPGLQIVPAADKGKLSISVAADATPGLRLVRLFDAEGTAAPLPFVVGTLQDLAEVEPNNTIEKAQATPSSTVVISGRLGASGDVDTFALTLKQGQTLVASAAAHDTLGSPVDSVLHVVSNTGQQLAYNHDTRGLDPEINFAAPHDGNFFVRLFGFPSTPNSTIGFAGGDTYLYRLTLTTGPFVDHAWPLAITAGRASRVELVGWNVPETTRFVTLKPEGESLPLGNGLAGNAAVFGPELANVALVAVEPHETLVEAEPNDRATPQTVTLPLTISGCIGKPGDIDAFRFPGTKGELLSFQLESRQLSFPLDGVLEITDAAGKSLARVDDVSNVRDPVIAFTPPEDGAYQVIVSDLNRQGSARHVYRLRAIKPQANFAVSADALAYQVTPDRPAEITLAIDRQQGFAEEIHFKVTGLPPFVAAASAISAATGDSAKSVKLVLTSTGGAFSGPLRIEAESTGAAKLRRTATAAVANQRTRLAELWLTATAAAKP